MYGSDEEVELESFLIEVSINSFSKDFITIILPPTTANYRYMRMACEEGSWQHFNRYPEVENTGYDAFPLYFNLLSDYAPATYSSTGIKRCIIGRLFPVVNGPKGYFYRIEDKGREEISKNNSSMSAIKLALSIEDQSTNFETTPVTLGDAQLNSYEYMGVSKLCSALKILLRFSFY